MNIEKPYTSDYNDNNIDDENRKYSRKDSFDSEEDDNNVISYKRKI